MHFIKVNDLKLNQVELLQFFHFMRVAANASEMFCMAHLANSRAWRVKIAIACLSIILRDESQTVGNSPQALL